MLVTPHAVYSLPIRPYRYSFSLGLWVCSDQHGRLVQALDGEVMVSDSGFTGVDGLLLHPRDGRLLLVGDGRVTDGSWSVELPGAQTLGVDSEGNLWVAATPDPETIRIQVYNPYHQLLASQEFPDIYGESLLDLAVYPGGMILSLGAGQDGFSAHEFYLKKNKIQQGKIYEFAAPPIYSPAGARAIAIQDKGIEVCSPTGKKRLYNCDCNIPPMLAFLDEEHLIAHFVDCLYQISLADGRQELFNIEGFEAGPFDPTDPEDELYSPAAGVARDGNLLYIPMEDARTGPWSYSLAVLNLES